MYVTGGIYKIKLTKKILAKQTRNVNENMLIHAHGYVKNDKSFIMFLV